MAMRAYRAVLALRDVRRILLLGFLLRVPLWAANVVITLHVVTHLHRSYGAAGLLDGVVTVAAAVSGPWRGRRLDRVGLRRTLTPSIVVLTACWCVAPFLGYWPLLGMATLCGLFTVPSFSVVRVVLMHAVPDEHRTSALSIDSVIVELSFMIGPAAGVLLATYCSTPWALFGCELFAVLTAVVLWLANPALRADVELSTVGDGQVELEAIGASGAGSVPAGAALIDRAVPVDGGGQHDEASVSGSRSERRRPAFGWLTPAVGSILLMASTATIVLTGADVGVVAALRHMHHQPWIGWELAVWGAGSALGGLIYGAMRRPLPAHLLVTLLAVTTVPVIIAREPILLAVLLFVTGLFCAPTITATVDALGRAVPERVRGEAVGWHGSAMTTGSAIGAPIAGVAIDAIGWQGAFLVTGLIGVAAAVVGVAVQRTTGRRRIAEPDGVLTT